MFARQSVRSPSQSSQSHLSHGQLPVGPVGDPLEKEADRMADRVLRAPDVSGAEKAGSGAEKAGSGAGVPSPSGGALDPSTRAWFEPRFGYDFSRVRIRGDQESAASARSLGAIAYTAGPEIAFDPAHYQPGSAAGKRLLAHELAHVVQQGHATPLEGRGAIRPTAGRVGPRIQRDVPRDASGDQATGQMGGAFRRQAPAPSLGNMPQLNLGGHTLDGDAQSARSLLQSQLTVGPMMQPTYLGSGMTLQQVSAMLANVTPALTEPARWALVQSVWWDKVSAVRQLPPLYDSPLTLSSGAAGGAGAPPVAGGRTLPTPQQAAANYVGAGLPDRAASSGIAQQGGGAGGPTTPGNWQPSAGPQVVINIGRGLGSTPRIQGAGQRQYTMGDNLQVVFQDSTDAASSQYSAVGGGQALGSSMIDSKVVQLQPFTQLLAGLSQMPGSFSATMVVQFSAGLQLTLKFGPITIQLSAGFQVTAQQGQGAQPAAAFAATIGPSNPAPGTGSQTFGPRNNWSIGIGPPPPLPGRAGSGDRQLGGGMIYFGGNLPSWLQ